MMGFQRTISEKLLYRLENAMVVRFLVNNLISMEQLESLTDLAYEELITPMISELIINRIIPFGFTLGSILKARLENPLIYNLVIDKKVHLDELILLSEQQIEDLTNDPIKLRLIEKRSLTCRDLLFRPLLEVYTTVYSQILYNLSIEAKLSPIKRAQQIERVLNDMERLSEKDSLSFNALLQAVLKTYLGQFARYLRLNVETMPSKSLQKYVKAVLKTTQDKLVEYADEPLKAFDEIFQKVNSLVHQSQKHSVFKFYDPLEFIHVRKLAESLEAFIPLMHRAGIKPHIP